MQIRIEGKGEEVIVSLINLLEVVTDTFKKLGHKYSAEADKIDVTVPQTNEELTKDLELRQRELSLREKRITTEEFELSVKQKELEARKMRAEVDHSETIARQQRLLLTQHGLLNRNTVPNRTGQSQYRKPQSQNKPLAERPKALPSLAEVDQKISEKAAASETPLPQPAAHERSGTPIKKEGQNPEKQPLTHPLGDKLKTVVTVTS